MRLIRVGFRLFKLMSMGYTLWRGTRVTRLVWIMSLVWKMIRRKPLHLHKPRVVYTFVDARDPVIYKRRGWRKIESNRNV